MTIGELAWIGEPDVIHERDQEQNQHRPDDHRALNIFLSLVVVGGLTLKFGLVRIHIGCVLFDGGFLNLCCADF